jgi:hypothetical protein
MKKDSHVAAETRNEFIMRFIIPTSTEEENLDKEDKHGEGSFGVTHSRMAVRYTTAFGLKVRLQTGDAATFASVTAVEKASLVTLMLLVLLVLALALLLLLLLLLLALLVLTPPLSPLVVASAICFSTYVSAHFKSSGVPCKSSLTARPTAASHREVTDTSKSSSSSSSLSS